MVRLAELLGAETVQLRSEVTSLRVDGKQVMAAVVNATKKCAPSAFSFAVISVSSSAPPTRGSVPSGASKDRQGPFVDGDRIAPPAQQSPRSSARIALLVWNKDRFEPLVGRFFSRRGPRPFKPLAERMAGRIGRGHRSHGTILKNMRKQIRRAIPSCLRTRPRKDRGPSSAVGLHGLGHEK